MQVTINGEARDLSTPLNVLQLLDELGLDATPGELVIRRAASQDGPARCFVNDQRTSDVAYRRTDQRGIGRAKAAIFGVIQCR